MPISVLIADDHAVVRDGLRMLFEAQEGFNVVGEVETGREAVRLARRTFPDVVVLDIAMPEMNGIEAAGQIHDEGSAAGIVMLSMYGSREYVYRALKAGARGYVLKRSAGAELLEAVRAVHAGKRYLCRHTAAFDPETKTIDAVKGNVEAPLASLSRREREVLQLIAEGRTNQVIAETLYLSPKTVHTYRSRILQKLGLHDTASLIKFAIQHGLTPEM